MMTIEERNELIQILNGMIRKVSHRLQKYKMKLTETHRELYYLKELKKEIKEK